MLLSISPNSTESENVVKELALASERKKPIIPVYLEAAEIPETMEYQLAGIQRVEYFREKEDSAIEAMLRSLVKRGVHVDEKFTRNDLDEELVVTTSIGLCGDPNLDDPQTLLREADRRLYEAKGAGRDTVVPAAN